MYIPVFDHFPSCSQSDTGRWPSSMNHSFVLPLPLPLSLSYTGVWWGRGRGLPPTRLPLPPVSQPYGCVVGERTGSPLPISSLLSLSPMDLRWGEDGVSPRLPLPLSLSPTGVWRVSGGEQQAAVPDRHRPHSAHHGGQGGHPDHQQPRHLQRHFRLSAPLPIL